ncbi:hypothetical protein P4N68_11600 [Corynebacterium felinum]|uniref:Uncharacterized protein n=1 Tax=Corynebacterium felinum TaxID=131318 RepID=A0ABU2BA66_9CORY|nr:hypothetical protein [Corynebacterium felinum]MDF5821714.1 hypothetical protein [Corynebacterium felinum]MDR7355266.1 hypothetical protein [Corynebacterium felinum]WJY94619.1 hypothetical protein CFELI_04950 [Corynebacterium felinum]
MNYAFIAIGLVLSGVSYPLLYLVYFDYKTWPDGVINPLGFAVEYWNIHIAFLFFTFAFSFSLLCILLLYRGNVCFRRGSDVTLANAIPDLIASWEQDPEVLKVIESAGSVETQENIEADPKQETASEAQESGKKLKGNSISRDSDGQNKGIHVGGCGTTVRVEHGKMDRALMTWIDVDTSQAVVKEKENSER